MKTADATVVQDKKTGEVKARPEREADIAKLRAWVQSNVERVYGLGQLK